MAGRGRRRRRPTGSTAPGCASASCCGRFNDAHHRPPARRRAARAWPALRRGRRRRRSRCGCRARSRSRWRPRRSPTSGAVDAVICLGCVIRGETAHYELVAGECAAGIQQVQLATGVPVVFGVLTTEDLDQALARSEGAGRPQRRRGGAPRSPSRWRRLAQSPSRRARGFRAGRGRPPTLDAVLKLVLPKGSLEKATLELFEAADLARQPVARGRLQGDHRRPPHRRGAHPAAPGDPPLRGRGALRPRHRRAGLDRGDGERRRRPRRARSTRRRRPARSASWSPCPSDSPCGQGRRPARRRAGLDRVPRAHPAVLREQGIEADIRLSYGATEAKVPDIVDCIVDVTETGRALRAAGLKIIGDDPRQLHRADRQPGRRTPTPPSATPWTRSRRCSTACSRPGARCW